jgi:hypothetical protein
MTKICLALIHNHNKERYEYISQELHGLKDWLTDRQVEVELLEVAYQPPITPHSRSVAFLRDAIQQLIVYKWATYLCLRPSLLSSIDEFLRLVSRNGRYAAGGAWRRSTAIEMILTDKHLRAWAAFLDMDSDYLICFEDDAVFTNDSKQQLGDLLEHLSHRKSDRNIYVNLAGGCSLDSLRVDKLQSGQDGSFRHYRKPVTNTACVYLMSVSLVAHFHKALIYSPWFRLIGADWMLNALFMQLELEGEDCACMHAEPPFFKHGSTTGEYLSLIR